jgi:HKD family nuclease
MAKLTTAQRNALASNQYVFPKTRTYPIPDKGHGQQAIRIGSINLSKGNLTVNQYNQIVKAVNSKFGFKARTKTNSKPFSKKVSLKAKTVIKPKSIMKIRK